MKMRSFGRTLTHAIGVDGLPYETDEELWEIELADPLRREPFPDQREHVPDPKLLRGDEQRLLASRGRLVRRSEAWGPDVAGEFSLLCARRARARVIQALDDASGLLGSAGR